ncbi:MAG: murein hydrolase activator EnvC family protein, partial [Fibrobacterota bacterium]
MEERKEMISQIRSRRENWESAVQELTAAQEEFNALIDRMDRKKSEIARRLEKLESFAGLQGTLAWPVEGEIRQPFGKIVHPEYKTVTRNNGIDISAPRGRPVRAVAEGVIRYVGKLRGYGNIVMVSHGGDYSTVYAHLDRVHVQSGDNIASRAPVGTVGSSGSLDGTKLHFEIRRHADALDPQEWLSAP